MCRSSRHMNILAPGTYTAVVIVAVVVVAVTVVVLSHDLQLRSYFYLCVWSVITDHNITPEKRARF